MVRYTDEDIISWCKAISNICEIPKRYGLWVNFGDLDTNYELVTDKRKYRLIADYRYRVEDEELRNLIEFDYVNFFQRDNWINLMEIVRAEKLAIWGDACEGLNVEHTFRYRSLKEEMLYHVYFALRQQEIPPEYGNNFNTFLTNVKKRLHDFNWNYSDDVNKNSNWLDSF